MFSKLTILLLTAPLCLTSPLEPAPPRPPSPECFTLTLAPPLKPSQCNAELEYFLEEQRRYDYLDFVGAQAPYIYTRPRTNSGPCFVTVVANDLFVTDAFTYGDLARFTKEILEKCRDGRVLKGKGRVLRMTDARSEWGGFSLRVDAWNPFPGREGGGGVGNGTLSLSALRVARMSASVASI